jgi:hypothetical protein
MKKLKFKVVATITKVIEVEVNTRGLSDEQIEEAGRALAHEEFNPNRDFYDEEYTEDSTLLTD